MKAYKIKIMIYFKKGKFLGGDLLDIIHCDMDMDDVTFDNWYNYRLTEDCCILEIIDKDNINLFRADNYGIKYVPMESEKDNPRHEIFWNSEATMVFDCLDCAVGFMQNYKDEYEAEIKELCDEVFDSLDYDEARYQFTNLNNLADEVDVDFLNELEDIFDETDLSFDSKLSSMKLLIMNRYKLRIEELRLSRLN